jgi:hypothetical protein
MTTTPRILLIGVIVELTLATAIVHITLGGALFTLNAAGYLTLGAAYLFGALAPIPAIRRFAWLPKAGLAAFAAVTVVAYLVTGPFFALGWITKAVELAIILLVLADLLTDSEAGGARRLPPSSA